MPKPILVAYATKHESTHEVAEDQLVQSVASAAALQAGKLREATDHGAWTARLSRGGRSAIVAV